MLSVLRVAVLVQCCLAGTGKAEVGCRSWTPRGETDVCCDSCRPGYHINHPCGPSPKTLCSQCEPNTFNVDPTAFSCKTCTQCVGAQVLVKVCSSTRDTECTCRKGLRCGDADCSFCVDECGRGQEPGENRSCRKCPDGTFNDQMHQKCKPWQTSKCSLLGKVIVEKGTAFSDVKCSNTSAVDTSSTKRRVPDAEQDSWGFWSLVLYVVLVGMVLILISSVIAVKIPKKATKKTKIPPEKKLPPEIPIDDPRTLIAVECSFHDAYQEQGSSMESLETGVSEDSRNQLIV